MRIPARPRSRQRLRRRSVRRRLTALYSTLFILSGAALLAISYSWSLSISSARSVPAQPSNHQQSPLAQAQARIHQLEYQVTGLSDQLHVAESHQSLVTGLVAALAVMAVVSVLLGWLIAGRILRPLRAMTEATRQISENDLGRRLATPRPRRRTQRPRRHHRRPARPAASRLQRPAAVHRQRLPRAAHPAHDRTYLA